VTVAANFRSTNIDSAVAATGVTVSWTSTLVTCDFVASTTVPSVVSPALISSVSIVASRYFSAETKTLYRPGGRSTRYLPYSSDWSLIGGSVEMTIWALGIGWPLAPSMTSPATVPREDSWADAMTHRHVKEQQKTKSGFMTDCFSTTPPIRTAVLDNEMTEPRTSCKSPFNRRTA